MVGCATQAVIAVLKDAGMSPQLRTLVDLEALLNDGSAFVCFELLRVRLSGMRLHCPPSGLSARQRQDCAWLLLYMHTMVHLTQFSVQNWAEGKRQTVGDSIRLFFRLAPGAARLCVLSCCTHSHHHDAYCTLSV